MAFDALSTECVTELKANGTGTELLICNYFTKMKEHMKQLN